MRGVAMPRPVLVALASLWLLAVPAGVGAQDAAEPPEAPGGDTGPQTEETAPDDAAEDLPASFSTVALGMDVDTVKNRLREDPNFSYRGDPDVTLTPSRQQQLIEVKGGLYIDRAFFQFEERALYIIILQLNRDRLDYYTMYTHLEGRYGEPAEFSPSRAVWESPEVRLSLEQPLTVKYVHRPVFERLVEAGEMERSRRDVSREAFVEQF
jgi:hypothetical protein